MSDTVIKEEEVKLAEAERQRDEARAACAEMRKALEWVTSSIPHYEGDDNLTEPVEQANKVLSNPNPGSALLAQLEAAEKVATSVQDCFRNDNSARVASIKLARLRESLEIYEAAKQGAK